jgi:predicted Ser/Thr protein kinase
MNAARCLPEDTLLALADGALAGETLDAVQTHLDSCATCRQLLVALSRSAGEATADPEEAQPMDLPVGRGTRIGRYAVESVVGAGGMGAVYAAHDPELERRVAIKLVHRRIDQPEEHLRQEARAMARLAHPNVVQIYDVGLHGGRTYIAMELVEGRTLRSWLQEAPRSSAEIVAAFVGAGRGLSAAHDAGLLHRDFKPDNVFVARDGRVKVGDFGLARPVEAVEERNAERRQKTACGTPAYLAPEVIAGLSPSVASDQFSFCVSLWEGLHGRRPFSGTNVLTLLEEARAGRIQPPARRIPAWLRRVVLRGLAADPAARHPSMAALLRALAPEPRRVRLPAAAALAAAAAISAMALGSFRPALARGFTDPRAAWQQSLRRGDGVIPGRATLPAVPAGAETRGCSRPVRSAEAG